MRRMTLSRRNEMTSTSIAIPPGIFLRRTIVRRRKMPGGMAMDVDVISFRLDNVMRRISDYDEPLENQDQVVIKRMTTMQASVRVTGRVQFPGTHVLQD